ncbi:MAG: flagellar basal body rod protein [Methylibium sp. NZG]|nr:MAG: flagellar basal body rod protein [Methylibium sp. NZG]
MSAAAAEPVADGAAPKKGKKKLIIMIAAALVLAGGGGGGYFYMAKKKADAAAAAAAEDSEDAEPARKPAKADPKSLPTYVPLDPFVVNLADKDADRFAQIGVTLQVDDPKFAEDMKTFMPAIRNGILMALAHKTSAELLERSGKEALAEEIMREAARPMGIEVDEEDEEEEAPKKKSKADVEEEAAPKKKKKKKRKPMHNPITTVLFSTFIIQ